MKEIYNSETTNPHLASMLGENVSISETPGGGDFERIMTFLIYIMYLVPEYSPHFGKH